MPEFFNFRVEDSTLRRKLTDERSAFLRGNGAALKANRASLKWLSDYAVAILTEERRRAPDPRHARLASIILSPAAHEATVNGFRWMIGTDILALDARVAAYYRAIEYGSDYWNVTRAANPITLFFVGAPTSPRRGASGQAGFGSLTKKAPRTRITKPVPAYHYMQQAVHAFTQGQQYGRIINEMLVAAGIPPASLRPVGNLGAAGYRRLTEYVGPPRTES